MRRKAEAGHVTGGRVGYDNRDVFANRPGADGRPKRLHVERAINVTEAAVGAIVRVVDAFRPDPAVVRSERAALAAELAEIGGEVERLTEAIVAGGSLVSLVTALKTREHRRDELRRRLGALDYQRRLSDLDVRRLAKKARGRLEDWQGLLGRQPEQARQILGKLLVGRITFTPREDGEGRYYQFAGQGSLGKLLTGVMMTTGIGDPTVSVVTPAGFEPAISTLKGSRPGPG